MSARAAGLEQRAVTIQARDDLALGLGVLASALLSYAVVSWLGSDDVTHDPR